mgnify:CR=1 FL=1
MAHARFFHAHVAALAVGVLVAACGSDSDLEAAAHAALIDELDKASGGKVVWKAQEPAVA